MKKSLTFLCIFCTLPVLADVSFEPQWSDFSPIAYKNIEIGKDYKVPVKKYWSDRRKNFIASVDYCKSSNDVNNCYSELRKIENEKTNMFLKQQQTNAIYSLHTLR